MSRPPYRYRLLGFKVDAFEKFDLLSFIADRVASRGQRPGTVVANLNLHALSCALRSPRMESLLEEERTFVHIDGMPIVWMSRLAGQPVTRENRLTYLDWASDMISLAASNGWSVAYLGSTEEICAKGIEHFTTLHPTLNVRGWDGYFDMEDDAPGSRKSVVISEIDAFSPDVLIVGMGMPRQEEFLQRHPEIDYGVAVCAGAFFEYLVGGQSLPPRWTGRLGVEWAWRLAASPRRYAHRYLVEPFSLAVALAGRSLSRRR